MSRVGHFTLLNNSGRMWLTVVVAIRAMRDMGRLWGDDNAFYLRAAATFVDNFHGWSF